MKIRTANFNMLPQPIDGNGLWIRQGITLLLALWIGLTASYRAQGQSTESREWSDSTGKFKVTGKLVEVKDGNVYLNSNAGKTLKIPVSRLSKKDQDFLQASENPFTEMGSEIDANPESKSAGTGNGAESWNADLTIDWDDVPELDHASDSEWKLTLPEKNELGFTPKRAGLNKKNHFHEDIRRLVVAPLAQRAVAGYTVSFSVPKPESRLALVDLLSGKTIHTSPQIGDMCPIAILNDGSTVVMVGTSNERSGYETGDQLQLWRVEGKKVVRTKSWVPFPNENERFGKKENGILAAVIPLPNDRLLMLSNHGRLVCIDALSRKPYWQTKLSSEYAIDASADRSLIGVADRHTILIIDPQSGAVKASTSLADKPHVGWPRVRWSASGKKLLYSFMSELRVLDLATGQWVHQCAFPAGGVLAPNTIDYPHDDFALVENRTLIHIPSQIKVCNYQDAKQITSIAGMSFISLQGGERGLIVPAQIPHPAAEKILAQAENDPSVFLIHPGVQVSIDASGAGAWSEQVAESLEKAAIASGYEVVAGSSISIVGSISGPKQEAVSYIARGSYIANVYQSSIRLVHENKDLWVTGGSNLPHMIQTSRDQSIQDKLDELGKTPNLQVFEQVRFPKMLQKPSDNASQGGNDALMKSTFTLEGLVDSQ